ncbi:RsmB/NOP family class I SAM-dependent RNA methyltransferase [Parvularcula dongshanensis]|uniref:16S rRNA (Cytosine967-C5)-methyltransferase n=1 Tax=Parvularcula dongshanensis TaxID=1173995 RepID=A0A840HZU2_9PROT|nr:RsmB/NOP family class I SAM-dependent RNA methyltransferase [Parvularcula dongshanensis]MBB4657937.1 16S rRNA (cytosine967-C5)-methyltransferase [Parvularcula dongshanensis]
MQNDERYPRRPDPRGRRGGDGDRRGEGRGAGRGGEKRPPRVVEGLTARQAALDVLRLVSRGDSLDKALGTCRSFAELEGSDRAFARQLATTVLRRQGSLDEVIETYLRDPIGPKQLELRLILRLLAGQLLLLGTPPHAAAMTATELAKGRAETRGYAKLVNAIGRRLSETGAERLTKVPLRADTPGWLWRKLERAYGPAATRAIAEAHQAEPPLDLTVPADREGWAERLEAQAVGPATLRRPGGGRIEALPGYEEGAWWVQDLAATLPVTLLGDLRDRVVFDLCAAPGGKTMQICAGGADVTAVDSGEGRMGLLRANLERTGLEARTVVADVLAWEPDHGADLVLLDAPCSATGTARRNPDVLRSKDEKLAVGLAKLQDRMIDRALSFLKPGGVLVFATCSLLPEEGEERAEAALARHAGLERLTVSPEELGGLDGLVTKAGDLRCHPGKAPGMDGFFATRLRTPA